MVQHLWYPRCSHQAMGWCERQWWQWLLPTQFQSLSASDMGNFRPFSIWTDTKRMPAGTGPTAKSRNGLVEQGLAQNVASYRQRTYALLTSTQPYNLISNHGSGSRGDTFESVHDNIHSSFGANS